MRLRDFCLAWLGVFGIPVFAAAAGVVSVCDETHFAQALQGGGTVEFDCAGTIAFTATRTISQDTQIEGNLLGVILDGGGARPLFDVLFGATLTLRGLTVRNGKSTTPGGAINSYGNLQIYFVQFLGNSSSGGAGGAIFSSGGTVVIHNSNFSGNAVTGSRSMFAGQGAMGGAIAAESGTMTLEYATLQNGQVNTIDLYGFTYGVHGAGGGIYTKNVALTIKNSTVASNKVYGGNAPGPGTIGYAAFGGGIAADGGVLSLMNATISDNTGIGGGIGDTIPPQTTGFTRGGGIYLTTNTNASCGNCTVVYNYAKCGKADTYGNLCGISSEGGGIYGYMSAAYTLVTGNYTMVWNAPPNRQCSTALLDGGHNYAYDTSCGSGWTATPYGTVGGTADNGGPTPTAALLAGMPPVNTGGFGCATRDQRGAKRLDACDAGAFEYGGMNLAQPAVALSFNPPSACSASPAALLISLSNSNQVVLNEAAVTISLPAGISAGTPAQFGPGCIGGAAAILPGHAAVRATGIGALQSCVITLPLTAALAGNFQFTPSATYALETAPAVAGAGAAWTVYQSPDDLGNTIRMSKFSGTLALQWTPVSNAASYEIFTDASPGGPFTTVGATASGSSTGVLLPSGGPSVFYRVGGYFSPCRGPK